MGCYIRALRLQGPLQLGYPLAVPLGFLLQSADAFPFRGEFLLDALKGQVRFRLLQPPIFDVFDLLGKLLLVEFLFLLQALFSFSLQLLPSELQSFDLLRQRGLSGRQLFFLVRNVPPALVVLDFPVSTIPL